MYQANQVTIEVPSIPPAQFSVPEVSSDKTDYVKLKFYVKFLSLFFRIVYLRLRVLL